MKILIISDAWYPQLNGVVRTYEALMAHLRDNGHEVELIGPSAFQYRIAMPGYKEIELVVMPYHTLAKKIEVFSPQSIHIATEGPLGWAARKYCLRHNIKFTSCYHSQMPDYVAKRVPDFLRFLRKPVRRLAIGVIQKFHNKAAGVLVTTKSISRQLKQWGITAPLYPFTRGVDEAIFKLRAESLFEDLPRPIALYVGRLAVEKNIEEFLDMPWEGSKVVVGSGPQGEELRKAYPHVYFMGKKTGKDLAAHYQSADVFVFPSRTDTFGIVLIEALACGLPIAAHYVSGPRDVVVNKTLGALDKDLSSAALAALSAGTKEERNAHVKEYYTWSIATAQFLDAQKLTLDHK